jgi:enamine deaminase RidA (YjgF/YER057c/UK114 family)
VAAVVHLKGQIALDRDGCVGGEMQDIVAITRHMTDIEAFMKTADIRREFFAPPFPVTTTVQVVRLFHPDLVVEITATAEVPNDRFRPSHHAHAS